MSSLSPKKQQELADKILERAELAQMARKLKLGLSKVASPKKSNPSNVALGNRNKKGTVQVPIQLTFQRLQADLERDQYRSQTISRNHQPEGLL